MEENLTFDFSFDVPGKIWQLAFDQNQGKVAIEVRDEEQQQSFFLVFDLNSLESTDFITIAEVDWWTTLVSTSGDYLFLEKYLDPQNPTAKSLLVYNFLENRLLAELEDFQMIGFNVSQLFGTLASDRNVDSAIDLAEIGMKPLVMDQNEEIIFPSFFSSGSETFELAKEYLQLDIALGVEYLEHESHVIISYYTKDGVKFDRNLVVIKKEEEILRLKQDTSLEGIATGAFMIMEGYLIFINYSNQINGVKI